MRFILKVLTAFALTALVSSCEYCNWAYFEGEATHEKMSKIRIGMTKQEVLDLMGEPLKGEKFNKPNVWFYYTNVHWGDTLEAREESTPVVFSEGCVVGWGDEFYKKEYEFKDWSETAYTEQEQKDRETIMSSLTEALQKEVDSPKKDEKVEKDLKNFLKKEESQ